MKVVLIGAGNVATHLGKAIVGAGHHVLQVYSRTSASANRLACQLCCEGVSSFDDLSNEADLYIVSVKDDALETVVREVCRGREKATFVHTAGSMPLSVFDGCCEHYGVIYPMQTFSKEKPLDFRGIPMFVEACDEDAFKQLEAFAKQLSERVFRLSTAARRHLHLSAVFACNFTNHCYTIAGELLKEQGIPFDVMLPLIDETTRKVHILSPQEAQTGPAVRWDENVIQKHLALLADHPLYADIYKMMSQSIHGQG